MPESFEKQEYWFIFQENHLLIQTDHDHLLSLETLLEIKPALSKQHEIAQINHVSIFCAEVEVDTPLPASVQKLPLRKALETLGNDWYTLIAKAYAIINWDRNHQFCGHCGNPTLHKLGTFERTCPICSLSFYPRISPSIIVLIHKGEEILMARGQHFLPGAYGLIAGFVEGGESVEDAVHREIKEEVGISVKNLRYFGSQAWPFPDSLMIGFFAEYAGGDLVINENEIAEAGWYHFNNLPGRPSTSISIAAKLIDHFIAEHQ